MARKNNKFDTTAIVDLVYPKIEESIKKNFNAWKKCLSSFIQKRHEMLFDTVPCDRIYYRDNDREELFDSLKLIRSDIKEGLRQTYYFNVEKFKPRQAKDTVTIVALCLVRYFFKNKEQKNLELAMIYLSFSGLFYPSIHYGSFPMVAPSKYRHVMEYVVNNKLSMKFDLKSTGSVIGAIKNINNTWINTYKDDIKKFEDEDVTYVIQQLHNRIKSFMVNIAKLYYEAYENKEYISYEKDSVPEEEGSSNYHLADNDSFKLQIYVDKTMTKINTARVDIKVCKMCADANVKTDELRSIFESIMNDGNNIVLVKEFITNMIATYLAQSDNKEIVSLAFLKFVTMPKPNTKDPLIIRMREISEQLLDDVSVSYRKRKHRNVTRQSYMKAFHKYFAITVINANK